MGKSKKTDREYTREQRIIQENRVLKNQVAALRKELARVDLDRYKNLKETVEKFYTDDTTEGEQSILDSLRAEWGCSKCEGYLEIFIYSKLNEDWYYRVCSNAPHCKNRTKAQRYTSSVKGIVKK